MKSIIYKQILQTSGFKEFLDKVKLRSQYDFGVEVTEKDKILTLSTCGNDSKTRVVLHAKKIK